MPSDLDIQRTRELKIRNDEMEKRLKNPQAPAKELAMPSLPEGAMNNPQFIKGYTDFMNTDRKGPSDPVDIQQRAIMAGLTAAAQTGVSRDETAYAQKQAGVPDNQQLSRNAYETGQAGLEKTQGEAAEKTGLSSYYSGLGEKERVGAENQRATTARNNLPMTESQRQRVYAAGVGIPDLFGKGSQAEKAAANAAVATPTIRPSLPGQPPPGLYAGLKPPEVPVTSSAPAIPEYLGAGASAGAPALTEEEKKKALATSAANATPEVPTVATPDQAQSNTPTSLTPNQPIRWLKRGSSTYFTDREKPGYSSTPYKRSQDRIAYP